MATATSTYLRILLLGLLPISGLAQQALPYDAKLLVQEPTSFMAKSSFAVSPQTRGMQGLNGVVLWVASDKKSLMAYQKNKLLWEAEVVDACSKLNGFDGAKEIRSVVSQSPVAVIFVFIGNNAFAEIDRETGVVSSAGVDLN